MIKSGIISQKSRKLFKVNYANNTPVLGIGILNSCTSNKKVETTSMENDST